MRHLLAILLTLTALGASAHTPDESERVSLGVEFETYFDNREYMRSKGVSGSDFASRLMPSLEWQFGANESLTVGLDWVTPFGEVGAANEAGVKSVSYYYDLKPLIYYSLQSGSWSVVTGLFPMSKMAMDSYSDAFFASQYRFYNNVMCGVVASYERGGSLFEVACDWMGQRSLSTREKFDLFMVGRTQWRGFNAGFNLSLMHFAGQTQQPWRNVVDNGLVAPYVEFNHSVARSVDVTWRVGYLQAVQRDRRYEKFWRTPAMWEMGAKVSCGGWNLKSRLYLGDDLQPLYDGQVASDGTVVEYGELLYTGAQDFHTQGGYLSSTSLSYDHVFSQGRVRLRGLVAINVTSAGVASQQILELNIKLGKVLYKMK